MRIETLKCSGHFLLDFSEIGISAKVFSKDGNHMEIVALLKEFLIVAVSSS